MRDPSPTPVDLRELAHVHSRLAAYGVKAGAKGYDLETLAAASYDQGWAYRIDRVVGQLGYQAVLQAPHALARHRMGPGIGWDPAVALSFALYMALEAQAVRPETRRPPAGS